jgi:hypothetical protein
MFAKLRTGTDLSFQPGKKPPKRAIGNRDASLPPGRRPLRAGGQGGPIFQFEAKPLSSFYPFISIKPDFKFSIEVAYGKDYNFLRNVYYNSLLRFRTPISNQLQIY